MTRLTFQLPLAFQIALAFSSAALLLGAWSCWRRRIPLARAAALLSLRGVALAAISFLCGWPVRQTETAGVVRQAVAVLIDRSESMALAGAGATRYEQALAFARDQLLPALERAGLAVDLYLFAEASERVDPPALRGSAPRGRETNLAAAIARAAGDGAPPPLAVVALTDGAANQPDQGGHALSALTGLGVPFIGVGFGSDRGTPTLALRRLDAPAEAAPGSELTLTAQLEATGIGEEMTFELVLMRDGRLRDTQTVRHRGSGPFTHRFTVRDTEEGEHRYEVRLVPPDVPTLHSPATAAQAAVRVVKEPELRVLYVQGALTWDYKFIAVALRDDPALRLTGLTRTADRSLFRQNVESAQELLDGFPATIEQLAPFRVVVLSGLRPADLSPAQQELLVRFSSELGGGVLVIGGAATFEQGWRGSRLEDLLPVVFAGDPGVVGLDQPFHLQVTAEALDHPLFRISDSAPAAAALWRGLPAFSHYGRVDAVKPGAEIWMKHPSDEGPTGRRVLMAIQRYGAGLTAALMVDGLWRWRLAKDAEPAAYDRFWRQLLRHLGSAGAAEVAISFDGDAPRPQSDVRVSLERQRRPANVAGGPDPFEVRVERVSDVPGTEAGSPAGAAAEPVLTHRVELVPARPVDVSFRADHTGLYRVSVHGAGGRLVALRTIEVRNTNVELVQTARDMEHLRQWAAASNGLALPAEECQTGRALVDRIRRKADDPQRRPQPSRPVGFDAWMLSALLLLLGAEWLLRKAWGLR
jgi:uncharacterized membrane protein